MDVGNVGAAYSLGIELQMEPLPEAQMPTGDTGSDAPHKYDEEQGESAVIPEGPGDRKFDEKLSKGFEEINKRLALVSNEMKYSYHKPTRSIAVKVFNSETKEVIREIPPQKALDALAKMWELAGILIDEKG